MIEIPTEADVRARAARVLALMKRQDEAQQLEKVQKLRDPRKSRTILLVFLPPPAPPIEIPLE